MTDNKTPETNQQIQEEIQNIQAEEEEPEYINGMKQFKKVDEDAIRELENLRQSTKAEPIHKTTKPKQIQNKTIDIPNYSVSKEDETTTPEERYNSTVESIKNFPKCQQVGSTFNPALYKAVSEQREHDKLNERLNKLEDKVYHIGVKDVLMFSWNLALSLIVYKLLVK